MKKVIALVLALVMIVALTACGGSSKKADADTVTIGVFEPASVTNRDRQRRLRCRRQAGDPGRPVRQQRQPTVKIGGKPTRLSW